MGGCYSGNKFSVLGRYAEVGGVDGLVAGDRGVALGYNNNAQIVWFSW